MLINLIRNANKFSHVFDFIDIFSYIDKENKEISVKVVDKGIGIVASETNSIFTPFFKSKGINGAMNPKGNGLGLYISKNICQTLGGDLLVESIFGEGATFIMTMKLFEQDSLIK